MLQIPLIAINWLSILACVVAGQGLLTIWFVVLFGEPWARAYGGEGMTKKQHTAEVPGYTYGIGAGCVLLLSLSLAGLRSALGISGIGAAFGLGIFVGLGLFIPMALPAYAFLKRWNAFLIGAGSQLVLAVALSLVLELTS